MLKSKTAEFNLKPLPKKQRKEVDTPCERTGITIANAVGITVVIFADRTTKTYETKKLRPTRINSKQRRQMRQNFINQYNENYNPKPVVKLFNPYGNQTWLLSEMDPENPNIVYGLSDLGFGCVEFGGMDLDELKSLRMLPVLKNGRITMDVNCDGKGWYALERDAKFKPQLGIWDYMKNIMPWRIHRLQTN